MKSIGDKILKYDLGGVQCVIYSIIMPIRINTWNTSNSDSVMLYLKISSSHYNFAL